MWLPENAFPRYYYYFGFQSVANGRHRQRWDEWRRAVYVDDLGNSSALASCSDAAPRMHLQTNISFYNFHLSSELYSICIKQHFKFRIMVVK